MRDSSLDRNWKSKYCTSAVYRNTYAYVCVHLLCLVVCAMFLASVDAIILTLGAFVTVLGLSVCGCLYAAILALQATRGPTCFFIQVGGTCACKRNGALCTYSKKLHEKQSHTLKCISPSGTSSLLHCVVVPTCRRWQEGLLPQLVTRSREDGRGGVGGQGGEGGSGAKWVILDGPLSPHKLETLLTLNDSDRLIKLSNGRGIPIDSSYRFILEVCHGLVQPADPLSPPP